MKPSVIHIAPGAEKIIGNLPASLKEKVKNALRDISRGEVGTTIVLGVVDKTVIARSPRRRRRSNLTRMSFPRKRESTNWTPAFAGVTEAGLLRFARDDGNGSASLHLYKAGRFRILFRRTNGSVWVDALMLEPIPKFAVKEGMPAS